MDFKIHDKNTANEQAGKLLEQAEGKYGFTPNILGVFAEAPAALEGYMTLMGLFEEKSDFSAVEQQVVLLTVSAENGCGYCMAAHSTIAGNTEMTDETLQALRENTALPDSKLEALRALTRDVVQSRGNPDKAALNTFFEAGYNNRHLLEVITGVALKTLSNYTNHLAETPLDEVFQDAAWTKEEQAA